MAPHILNSQLCKRPYPLLEKAQLAKQILSFRAGCRKKKRLKFTVI